MNIKIKNILKPIEPVLRDDRQKVRLVFKEADFEILRSHLLKADRKERAGFIMLGKNEIDGWLELYAHRLVLPHDEDYYEQHAAMVEPNPEYVLRTFSNFAESGVSGYLHAHSHPFSDRASFSSVDDHYLPGMRRSLGNYLGMMGKQPESLFVRLVWGQDEAGFTAECYGTDGSQPVAVDKIKVVGGKGIRTIHCFHAATEKTDSTGPISERFQRQVRFLGEDGQHSIQKTRLAICGVGGLGSFVVAGAKGLGFRDIALIDPDIIEESNLNRFQGAGKGDIGKAKVDAIAEAIKQFDPDIKLKPVQAKVQDKAAREAILDADFIINCLDSDSARMEVQLLAARHLKPLLDLGSGIVLEPGTRTVKEMGGQAILYYPGGPCLLCQGLDPAEIVSDEIRRVHRATGYIQGTDETPPSVVTINAVMAGLGLQIAISYLTGFAEAPAYLRYDLLRNQTAQYSFTRRPECPVCGEHGIEGRGEEVEEMPSKKRPKRVYRGRSLPQARTLIIPNLVHSIRQKSVHLFLRWRHRRQNARGKR